MPSAWGTVSAANVLIKDTDGNELVAETAATIAAADTTSAAVSGGDEELTLTTGGTWVSGEPIRYGSDDHGWRHDNVKDYTSSTKLLEPEQIIRQNYAAGIAVQHRTMTYALDTDTSTDWDSLEEVTVRWIPDSDDMPFREIWAVLDTKSASSGLEQKFATGFSRYYEEIEPEHFTDFENRARARLKLLWENRERDVNKLVDNEILDDLLMLQIAILICISEGNEYDDELVKLKVEFKEQLAVIDAMPIWIDDDEDDIKDESEYQKSKSMGIGRGL
jgi:hypothetical protein